MKIQLRKMLVLTPFLFLIQCLNAQEEIASNVVVEESNLSSQPDVIPFILDLIEITERDRHFSVRAHAIAPKCQQIDYVVIRKEANRAFVELESAEAIGNIFPWESVPRQYAASDEKLGRYRVGKFFGVDKEPANPDTASLESCLFVEDIQRTEKRFLSLLKKSSILFSTLAPPPQNFEFDLKQNVFVKDDAKVRKMSSMLASNALSAQNRALLPKGANTFKSDFENVMPWLITNISIVQKEGKLHSISGTKHYSETRVHPSLCMPTVTGSVTLPSGRQMRPGNRFEIRPQAVTKTRLKELEELSVTVSTPSGEPYPLGQLLEHNQNLGSGFLITGFQEIDPRFLAMLKPDTPIFKMSSPNLSDFDNFRIWPRGELDEKDSVIQLENSVIGTETTGTETGTGPVFDN